MLVVPDPDGPGDVRRRRVGELLQVGRGQEGVATADEHDPAPTVGDHGGPERVVRAELLERGRGGQQLERGGGRRLAGAAGVEQRAVQRRHGREHVRAEVGVREGTGDGAPYLGRVRGAAGGGRDRGGWLDLGQVQAGRRGYGGRTALLRRVRVQEVRRGRHRQDREDEGDGQPPGEPAPPPGRGTAVACVTSTHARPLPDSTFAVIVRDTGPGPCPGPGDMTTVGG